jgi:hypothetical protein
VSVMTMMCSRNRRRVTLVVLAGALMTLFATASANAQAADDPNPGAITFTGGLDVPSIYFFRGLRQETDQKLTLWPYGDLGIAFFSGDGGLKSAGVNVGVWNSLHTGTSGTNGPSAHAHYEEDFYATLSLGFGGGLTVAPGYMALTSPNLMFNTVKEFQLKVSKAHMLAPYGFLAMELTEDGHADAGTHKGTYLELGVGPSWPLVAGGPTLAIPVKLGLSLKDYYEDATGNDSKFGFFDVGGLITLPLKGIPSRFGAWNIHGGLDFLFLGDTPKLFNVNKDGEQKDKKVVGLFGIGVTY